MSPSAGHEAEPSPHHVFTWNHFLLHIILKLAAYFKQRWRRMQKRFLGAFFPLQSALRTGSGSASSGSAVGALSIQLSPQRSPKKYDSIVTLGCCRCSLLPTPPPPASPAQYPTRVLYDKPAGRDRGVGVGRCMCGADERPFIE